MSLATPRLRGRPARVFVSVDESTGVSTISFDPANCSAEPLRHDGDKTGEVAMREARSISQLYPGCTVHGPHFHAARPVGKWRKRRKPADGESGGSAED
jgi:hypothetical protein